MKTFKILKICSVFFLLGVNTIVVFSQSSDFQVASGKFQPTDESLKQYQCPEWFRDAKFGIWSHWGPVCVPGYVGNWYARNMYIQGSREYKYHVENYGHPSEFGYKDIINLWKAEKFDPDYLMDLYVKAGAKYFVSMGVHHDNFDLWDSKHEWNTVNFGPKRDIVGSWKQAALKRGLRFGVSEHLVRSYNWLNVCHTSDTSGAKKGVPYDGNDPKYEGLYMKKHDDMSGMYPLNPSLEWKNEWYNRVQDLVTKYKPDLVYTDGGIPFEDVGLRFMADYYNQNMKNNKGKLEAVYNYKDIKKNCGRYIDGAGVEDLEQVAINKIKPLPWQTCETAAQWFWTKEPWKQKSGADIVVMLTDIVSKNGNLLLNIPQKSDGTIDDWAILLLKDVGDWLSVNGEGIYGSRPWTQFGEGPSLEPFKGVRRAKNYTSNDFRFTTKDGYLYAFCLSVPTTTLKIKSLAGVKIKSVSMLGYEGKLDWRQEEDGLTINPVSTYPSKIAVAYKIKLK